MPRQARAAFLYDIQEILDRFEHGHIDSRLDRPHIRAFLEKELFRTCGFLVIRTLPDSYYNSPCHEYLKWKIPATMLSDIFPRETIPYHLRCEECHVFVRDTSVLIAYF